MSETPKDILAPDSPLPKHYRVRELLRRRIRSMEADEPIPSEAALCEAYGVSRTTVRKALERLTYEGLVYRVQGKGTYVAPPKLKGRYVQTRAGFYDEATSRGLQFRTEVLNQRQVKAGGRIAAKLRLREGAAVMELVRLRLVEEEPMLLSHSYVSEDLCPGITEKEFTMGSLYGVMRQVYGIEIRRGTRVLEAALPDEREAELMGIRPGTPLLVVTGTMCDSSGVPVEYGFAKHRGDRSQVEIEVVTGEK